MSSSDSYIETAEKTVDIVMKDLKDRRGFRWWWDDIDADIQEEIVAELQSQVSAYLEARDL